LGAGVLGADASDDDFESRPAFDSPFDSADDSPVDFDSPDVSPPDSLFAALPGAPDFFA
jgi:hypothetical protein